MWTLLRKYKRFYLWKNRKSGCRECFWSEIDPNKIIKEKEEQTYKYSQAQKNVKCRKKIKEFFKLKCPNCGGEMRSIFLDMKIDKVVYKCKKCEKEWI